MSSNYCTETSHQATVRLHKVSGKLEAGMRTEKFLEQNFSLCIYLISGCRQPRSQGFSLEGGRGGKRPFSHPSHLPVYNFHLEKRLRTFKLRMFTNLSKTLRKMLLKFSKRTSVSGIFEFFFHSNLTRNVS